MFAAHIYQAALPLPKSEFQGASQIRLHVRFSTLWFCLIEANNILMVADIIQMDGAGLTGQVFSCTQENKLSPRTTVFKYHVPASC